MSKTVPGGYYIGTDGKPKNANGELIDEPKAKKPAAKKPAAKAKAK